MNAPRCSPNDYIAYQVASPSRYTCTEAARCQPEAEQAPAHDAFTRLLQRPPADTADLWQEAQQLIPNQGGGCWWWTTPPWTSPRRGRSSW